MKPVAWLYKGDAWFDGNKWHDNFEVTTSEQVAKFRCVDDAVPLYTIPPAVAIPDDIAEKYQELIMAVGKKFPNETRHETALKYIMRCELTSHPVWMATQTEYPK